MAVREGFKALPRRGLETGGLLIGTKSKAGNHVVVDVCDFEPVESEHATGPSYLLSETDRRLLETRIAARKAAGDGLSIVGFYRSHTRRDFAMTVEDASLSHSTYFRNASDVFLLIKSNEEGPPTGGFIIREKGKVVSSSPYVQFPFEGTMVSLAPCVAPVPVLQLRQPAPRIPLPVQAAVLRRAVRTARWPVWLAAATAMALAVALPFVIQRRIAGPAPGGTRVPLALSVTSSGNALRLSWNHRATRRAGHAMLWIKDGRDEQRFELDSRQLDEGSVAYWPRNNDVTFRLQVLSPEATLTESVRAIGGPFKDLVADPGPAPVADSSLVRAVSVPTATVASVPAPAGIAPSIAPVVVPPARRNNTGAASRRATRTFELPPPESVPPAVASVALPEPPIPQAMAAPPLVHGNELVNSIASTSSQGLGTDPSLRVSVEPVSGSRLAHLARSIPLLGRAYKRADYVPPAPRDNPALTSPHPKVSRDVNVDVRVYVNPSGKVEYSEVLSKVSKADMDVATWAVFSARHWEFVPARTGEGAVPGEVILHYQLGPGSQAAGDQARAGR